MATKHSPLFYELKDWIDAHFDAEEQADQDPETPELLDEETADLVNEWREIIRDMPEEDVQTIADFFRELRDMGYEERQSALRGVIRAAQSPEEARAKVVAELQAGREPAGSLLGDWLSVDPALQAFFKVMFHAMNAPDTVLHLAPQGFVVAA